MRTGEKNRREHGPWSGHSHCGTGPFNTDDSDDPDTL